MSKKSLFYFALALPIVVLSVWIVRLQIGMGASQRVLITVDGYDPRSLISGHYLHLRPDWEKTDCRQFSAQTCPKEIFESTYRFYIPEKDAEKLERLINAKRPLMQLEFALSGDSPLIRSLYIEEQPWTDWYRLQE